MDENDRIAQGKRLAMVPFSFTAVVCFSFFLLFTWIWYLLLLPLLLPSVSIIASGTLSLASCWSLLAMVESLHLVEPAQRKAETLRSLLETLHRQCSLLTGRRPLLTTKAALLEKECVAQLRVWRRRIAVRSFRAALKRRRITMDEATGLLTDLCEVEAEKDGESDADPALDSLLTRIYRRARRSFGFRSRGLKPQTSKPIKQAAPKVVRGTLPGSADQAMDFLDLALDKENGSIEDGSRVLIRGLISQPQYNGKLGRVLSLNESSGRYLVALDGPECHELALKRENLSERAENRRLLQLTDTIEQVLEPLLKEMPIGTRVQVTPHAPSEPPSRRTGARATELYLSMMHFITNPDSTRVGTVVWTEPGGVCTVVLDGETYPLVFDSKMLCKLPDERALITGGEWEGLVVRILRYDPTRREFIVVDPVKARSKQRIREDWVCPLHTASKRVERLEDAHEEARSSRKKKADAAKAKEEATAARKKAAEAATAKREAEAAKRKQEAEAAKPKETEKAKKDRSNTVRPPSEKEVAPKANSIGAALKAGGWNFSRETEHITYERHLDDGYQRMQGYLERTLEL
jgi:hypothetical protein